MAENLPFAQQPEVAVTVIAHGARILGVHNERWGVFTLPMTRRRAWQDPEISPVLRQEEWEITATRAAAEVLGRTFPKKTLPKPLLDPNETRDYRQSDADGVWKVYHLRVSGLAVEDTRLAPGVFGEWLAPDDFREREPISPTARYVIDKLRLQGRLPPWPAGPVV